VFKPMPNRLDCLTAFQFKFKQLGENECWIWLESTYQSGYGRVFINSKNYRAHRVAFFLHNGLIDNNLDVCHSCDNPICVNPHHLWQGNSLDNNQDAIKKGRAYKAKGENHGLSIFNNNQIIEIREKYTIGKYTQQQLADEYNTTRGYIHKIINRKIWKHI
jgi:hypothetical protein